MSVKLMKNNKEDNKKALQNDSDLSEQTSKTEEQPATENLPEEIGGRTQGLNPTRYGRLGIQRPLY